MTTDIQDNLAAICKLLDKRTVECERDYLWHPTYPTAAGLCPRCGGAGRIPDPQYDALRKVVQEVRWCLCSSPDCTGSAYGPVDVSQWPSGALWGALIVALEWTLLKFTAWERLKALGTDRPDLDLAALQVVREALEVKP